MMDKKKRQLSLEEFVARGQAAQKAVDKIMDKVMGTYDGSLELRMRHLVTELIYHGRFFSPSRDKVVTEKAITYILAEFKRWKEQK